MSNLTFNINIKSNDKIIIKDDSDDSFNSKKSSFTNKNTKKSLLCKISNNCDTKEEIILKKNTKKKFNNNKVNSIINKTKNILEKSYVNYQKSLEEYYKDVLDWMNMIYSDDSKSILKVQIKRITLNEDIFLKYNEIITKYKLKKDIFNIENFDIEDNYDFDSVVEIAKIMTKNLLEKLNYKLDIYNNGKSKKIRIKNMSNQI